MKFAQQSTWDHSQAQVCASIYQRAHHFVCTFIKQASARSLAFIPLSVSLTRRSHTRIVEFRWNARGELFTQLSAAFVRAVAAGFLLPAFASAEGQPPWGNHGKSVRAAAPRPQRALYAAWMQGTLHNLFFPARCF